jgi:hypothetical protein
VGALVTLELPADSPAIDLPWIITFGPLNEDDEWDPVVCGPYERPHALALAESVVADEELMAVVEPLQPHVTIDQIRGDIAAARLAAEAEADEEDDEEFDEDEYEEFEDEEFDEDDEEAGPVRAAVDDEADESGESGDDYEEFEDDEDDEDDEADVDDEGDEDDEVASYEGEEVEPTPPPTPEEIRAGFARIAAKLAGSAS